jgi:predicted PurR-regulated permease PerM
MPVRYASVVDAQRTRLHVSGRSVVRAVAMLALTVAALAMVSASARVIGWVLVAATFAGLLSPVVNGLANRMPRGAALALVVVLMLGLTGLVAYRVVDDINDQLHELQEALPRAAHDIERSDRFGDTAREAHLADRVTDFVDELPERLRGGSVNDALRSAATRGVAFLATFVLTIFFLIHGPRLLRSGLRQLQVQRRERVKEVAAAAYERAWKYLTGSIGMAAIAGLLAYGCAKVLDLPGAAPLSLWMALIDVIPVVGVVLGALPIVLLTAATSPAWQTALVAIVLVGWQVVETLYLQKKVERASLHVGPFVTVSGAMVGLELYGIGGALISLVLIVVVLATADEVVGLGPGPDEDAPVASAA